VLPRERTLTALAHKTTDRVPLDFWGVPEICQMLRTHFHTDNNEGFLQALGIDIRQFQPNYIGPALKKLPDGSFFDAMGTHRRKVRNEFCEYDEYASSPLDYAETVSDLMKYTWPNIKHFDFASLPEKIGGVHKIYYIKLETGGLFELAWALRGYERFMIDLIEEPEIVHFIMGKITDFYCEYVRRVMQYAGDKYDMVYTYDDIAGQNSLLISKDLWKEFIKPYHVQLNKVIRDECGKTVMYHSCGAVYDIIPLLAELPIDVLNPLQPLARGMDFHLIKHNYGKVLSFHGGIDIQHMLPHGTRQEIEEAVHNAIAVLGENGGYILTSAHYIQADTPVENIVTMYEYAAGTPMSTK